jgi:hypothetical protein
MEYYSRSWPHSGFETSNEFYEWTKNMDIDYIEVSGPPDIVLPALSIFYTIGRGMIRAVPPVETHICTGPFNVTVAEEYKSPLNVWLNTKLKYGYPLLSHAHQAMLLNFPSRRISTQDLLVALKESGCELCRAVQYGFKGGLEGFMFLETLNNHPGVSIVVDVGIEEIPTSSPSFYIPLVKASVPQLKKLFPDQKMTPYNYFVPFQSRIEKWREGFGGIKLDRRMRIESDLYKVIVYPKTTHLWKAACESPVIEIPKNFVTFKQSLVYMEKIHQLYLQKKDNCSRTLRMEFRVQFGASLQETIQKVYGLIVKLRKCLVCLL